MTDLFHLLHDRNRFLTQDRLIYYLYSCLIHDYLYYPTSPWLSLSFKNSLSKSACSCLSTGHRWQACRCTLEFHRAARHLPGVTQFPVVLEISILSNATASWIEMDGLFFRANNFDAFGESSTKCCVSSCSRSRVRCLSSDSASGKRHWEWFREARYEYVWPLSYPK